MPLKLLKITVIYFAFCCLCLISAWGVLALYYFDDLESGLKIALAVIFGAISISVIITYFSNRWRWRVVPVYLVLFILLVAWWRTIEPSNNRDWQTEVAVLPYATINGNQITMHNIRNFDYKTEYDFVPAYYDRQFDLDKLEAVDLIEVYWMGPAIAHIFLSFNFEGEKPLAISIETRKEKHETYSSLEGFFRQYELFYVVADERDVIRLRTSFRKDPPEDVYIYRLQEPLENGKKLFMEYIKKINDLKEKPEWYNTLTTNCTTTIWMHAHFNPDRIPFSWKILASGYVPEYLYENNVLDTSVTFAELTRRGYINPVAQKIDNLNDFSQKIRVLQQNSEK